MNSERPSCPIVVDSMRNETFECYSALSERFVVIFGGKITFISGVGPWNYKPDQVRAHIGVFR